MKGFSKEYHLQDRISQFCFAFIKAVSVQFLNQK
jgi:hypothetical protein